MNRETKKGGCAAGREQASKRIPAWHLERGRPILPRIFLAFLILATCLVCGCSRRDADAGDVYRLPLHANPGSLDPAKIVDVYSEAVVSRIFSTLVRHDNSLKIRGDLAEQWESSADGKTYTFRLREGVRFHNGRLVTAEDVKYSLKRLLDPAVKSQRSWVMMPVLGAREFYNGSATDVSGIEILGEREIRITLAEPLVPFLSFLATPYASVVPREVVEQKGAAFEREPVGSGPFKFMLWIDNSIIELERFNGYYEGPAKLERLRFVIVPDASVAYEKFLAGELEHAVVPPERLDSARAEKDDFRILSACTLQTMYIGIRCGSEPYGTNADLRRALNAAVDRKFIAEKIACGSFLPAKGPIPPGIAGFSESEPGCAYDPAAAAKFLEAAGYPNGKGLPEETLYFRNDNQVSRIAQSIEQDFKAAGIPVKLRSLDWGALKAAIESGQAKLFLLSWVGDYADADNFLFTIFHSAQAGSAGNRARFSSPEFDAAAAAERRETDPSARTVFFRTAENIVIRECPWVFLFHPVNNLAVKSYVQGLEISARDTGPGIPNADLHKVFFKK